MICGFVHESSRLVYHRFYYSRVMEGGEASSSDIVEMVDGWLVTRQFPFCLS